MLCGYCDKEFTPKNSRRRFCSDRCRSADWHRKRGDDLALVEEQLSRALTRVRVPRGAKAAG